MVSEVKTFSHVLDVGGNIRLPKHALVMRQASTDKYNMRFVYVLDMRDCMRDTFRVYRYIPSVGKVSYYRANAQDSIGRAFIKYVRNTYIDKRLPVPAPIWPIYHRDNIGQPRDRKPQKFDAKHAYVRGTYSTEERYVTDGAIVGTFRHTDESYSYMRLGMDRISYTHHDYAIDVDSLVELPSLV